ncbi:hypothetical protein Lal_00036769 [Lupinus albus]|nr:hypothetical protein Lal_00036769 [Lupinus albus]
MKGAKEKKSLITKTWDRCKSIGGGHKSNIGDDNHSLMTTATTWRSRSCPNIDAKLKEEKENSENKKGRVAPEGCFSVYVGPQMQRFVIKTEYANHPLFKMLLEEAESEYGYNSQGPLALPCKVEIFTRYWLKWMKKVIMKKLHKVVLLLGNVLLGLINFLALQE